MSDEIVEPVAAPVAEAPAVQETPTPASLDDTMLATLKEIRAREPSRADDGKFQPKAGAETATPEGVEVPGSPKAAPPDPAPPVIEAPQSLPASVKEKWTTLPPDVQAAWAAREGEVHKKFTSDGERLKSLSAYEELGKSLEPRLKQVNAPAPEYFRRLASADQVIANEGLPGLERVMREAYGIDLRAAFSQPGNQPDPSSALTRELFTLKSEISQLKSAAAEAQTQAGLQIINEFKKDKPYFDEALDLMNELVGNGIAKDLPTAYDMAINASPEIRAKREAEAKAAADKKAVEEAKAKQEKDAKLAPFARRAGSTPTAPAKKGNWEDTMREVQADIRARG